MQEFLTDDLTIFAVPLYLLAVVLEARWARKHGLAWYRGADTRASLAMGILATLVEIVPRLLALAVMVWLHDISPLRDVIGRQ